MTKEERLNYLITYLQEEAGHQSQDSIEQVLTFRALCNMREPIPVPDEFLNVQNQFLTEWNNERTTISIADLKEVQPQLYIWQGDITRLAVDAIVNAANSELLGCKIPNHYCVDNIIHTRAGVQLRLDCHDLIVKQGRKEAAGKAKITKGYNLPAKYVIHTVGPFIDARGVSPLKEHLLASCYEESLKQADEYKLSTIAFCCISTGEFNFPNERAAEIAVETVKEYLQKTKSDIQVIFNVFKDEDLHIYESLLTI